MTTPRLRSARYHLSCPCGRSIAVTTAQAGQTIRCACGKEIPVPSYREIRALEPVSSAKARPRRSSRQWTGRHRRLLIGSLVTIVAAALLGYTYASRPSFPEVAALPLEVSWPYWQALRQGLDRHPSPWEQQFAKDMDLSRLAEGMWLSVMAAGFLFTAVSFILRPRRSRSGVQ